VKRGVFLVVSGSFWLWLLLACGLKLAANSDIRVPNWTENVVPGLTGQQLKQRITLAITNGASPPLEDIYLLMKKEPLEQLTLKASLASGNIQNPESVAMAKRILKLQPRYRVARKVLVSNAIQEGDFDKAISLISELITLNKGRLDEYEDWLGAIGMSPEGRNPILQKMLKDQPKWGQTITSFLASNDNDPAYFYELYKIYPHSRQIYLRRLINKKEWALAYESFLSFSPLHMKYVKSGLFNGEFEDLDAPHPFNWKIDKKLSSFDTPNGLYARYYGKGKRVIAEQVTALDTGDYNFSVNMTSELFPESGSFVWRHICTDTKQQIFELAITETKTLRNPLELLISIPDGCAFQKLTFEALPGSYPRISRVELSSVSFTPSN